ncbi:efflux transporter outer membrane subunit [Rudaea sp.]|uniref:efflux transporter outer membrane subunit n=1 Tax=Rudaea sp. TaxID=2136325 RepID=UPI0025D72F0A|nr:efflux transporter outer membrane subunit [Rudaea sp.]
MRPAAAIVAALLSACAAVGPNYRAPQLDAPAAWSEAHGDFAAADPSALRAWWRAFDDPLLERLVERALADNQDLHIALARLRQARAERAQIAADAGPTVSAAGTAQALRSSQNLDWPPGIGGSRTWRAGFDASWEIDVFGGTRRAIEAADAQVEALASDRRALQVSLLAELALDYAELRTAQARLQIARDNIGNLREGERLAEHALRQGLGTSAEWAQARAEREAAEAQPPLFEAEIGRWSHAIGVLAGGFAGDWSAALAAPAPMPPTPPKLPLTLPSDVILQRPDLRADERRLAAATARIGVTEAARFPRFSIPLSLGTTASMLHDLFKGASVAWTAGLQVEHTLYDAGRAQAGVAAAQAATDAARLVYERDVRLALRDVEDAVSSLNGERRRRAALDAAVRDSELALERVTRLYRGGLSAYLPVLVAQRAANAARDVLALGRGGEVRNAIALYKALGAGWSEDGAASDESDTGARAQADAATAVAAP